MHGFFPFANRFAAVLANLFAGVWGNDHERWQLGHAVHRSQAELGVVVSERDCQPWHLRKVPLELFRRPVVRHKDDFHNFPLRIYFSVEAVLQRLREGSTGRSPVCSEVKAEQLASESDHEPVEADRLDVALIHLAEFVSNDFLQLTLCLFFACRDHSLIN